ncbi:MAG: hypothetical protein HA489_07955 [Archaeoglobales archaeon]|nr:hypothetical protein [Archaeoglobales archaeon]
MMFPCRGKSMNISHALTRGMGWGSLAFEPADGAAHRKANIARLSEHAGR